MIKKMNNWMPRRDENNSKTINQIHKEAKREVREQQQVYQNMTNYPKRIRDDRDRRNNTGRTGSSEDGWTSSSKSSKCSYSVVDPSKLKLTKPDEVESIRLGPGGRRLQSWGRSSSGGTKTSSDAEKTALTNRFSTLSEQSLSSNYEGRRGSQRSAASSRESSRGRNSQLPPAIRKTPSTCKERENLLETIKGLTRESKTKAPETKAATDVAVEESAVSDPGCSEEDIQRKTKRLIDEFLRNNDIEETIKSVTEMVSPNAAHVFIDTAINAVLEQSSRARYSLGQLLFSLLKKKVIELDQYKKVFCRFAGIFKVIDDCALDITLIYDNLGEIMEAMIEDSELFFKFLKEILQPCLPSEKADMLLSSILHTAAKRKGKIKLLEVWRESGVQWSDIIGTDRNVAEFIEKHKLEFTLIPMNSQTQMSIEEVKKHLLSLLEKNSELEEVFDWVDDNVYDIYDTTVIRCLVTAVHESCLSGSGTTWELNTSKLKSRMPLISRYISTNENLQLQALYAIQALMNKLGQPSGLLHQIFDVLYDDDVISDESFKEWEQSDDPNEAEGKGVAVHSVRSFFTWLREPEEETEEIGHSEFGQGYHQGPYGYSTQALSVASNAGHDIKPVASAQQGMYSNAGMPTPAQHHQSMGGPIASPQPIIQQGQQISRNPIAMRTAAAYYPRNSVPPRTMQSMARNPIGAVVNQPGQQPSSQYGPMPTMVPLQPNFTSFPPTMVNPQFPQMYQQRAYNPPQYPIMASQQYLWNYNTPPPQNSNGYSPYHGMSSYQSMPPQSIPAQTQPWHTTRKGANAIPIIDPKTGENVLSVDKNAKDSSSRPNSEKESDNSDSNICVQFATQVDAVLNNSRSDIASKQPEPVRIDPMCSHENEGIRLQEPPVGELVDENINELQNIENLSEVEFTDNRNLMCSEEITGPYYSKDIDSNSINESESGATKNVDSEAKAEEREQNVLEVPIESSVPDTEESVKGKKNKTKKKKDLNKRSECKEVEEIDAILDTKEGEALSSVPLTPSVTTIAAVPTYVSERNISPVPITGGEILNAIPLARVNPDTTPQRDISSNEQTCEIPSISPSADKSLRNKIALFHRTAPKYRYKEDQWSPLNPEGKKKYHREFLLVMQTHPLSLCKPSNLPKLSVVKDKFHIQELTGGFYPFTPGAEPKIRKKKAQRAQQLSSTTSPKPRKSVEMKEHLSSLLEKDAKLEEIFDWINANVPETRDPTFIRTLVTAVHKNCCIGSGTSWKVDMSKLKSRTPLISRYVSTDEKLQLHALYAAQTLSNQLNHPSGLLHQMFDVLYDEGVVSDEALLEWEKNDDPYEEKDRNIE